VLKIEQQSYDIAGKVFVLGEYAVLAGSPAVVAAVAPRFKLEPGDSNLSFPEGSPADRLLTGASNISGLKYKFIDPRDGRGGFGASTAQFALTYKALSDVGGWSCDWINVLKKYHEVTANEGLRPSGADLVAQLCGGVALYTPSSSCVDVWPFFDWSTVLVFSATEQSGRKVATHEHLKNQDLTDKIGAVSTDLKKALNLGIASIKKGDVKNFGEAVNIYGDVLRSHRLEIQRTSEDRRAFSELSEVLGVKGTGAMQSDALVVIAKPGADKTKIITVAKQRGLRLVADGIAQEPGLRMTKDERTHGF